MNTCRLHGSPKSSGPVSPIHHSRVQNLNLMDDMTMAYAKEHRATSPASATPIIEHKLMTPRRQQNHHQLHMNNDLSSNGGCKATKNKLMCTPGCPGAATSSTASGTGAGTTSHQHHQQHQHQSHSHHAANNKSSGGDEVPVLRHRWQACPELHKAMDGVNYIADHTKKEEESTKVGDRRQKNGSISWFSCLVLFRFFSSSDCFLINYVLFWTLNNQMVWCSLIIIRMGYFHLIRLNFHSLFSEGTVNKPSIYN